MLSEHRVLPCEGHDDCEELAACPLDDDAAALLERMYRADGLILATPVYYEDVSGQMKVFIDRNCFNNYHEVWLSARSVGLIAVAESTGLDDAIDSLRRFVALSSDKKVKPLSVTGLAYREGDAAGNATLVAAVREMAAAMAAALRAEAAALGARRSRQPERKRRSRTAPATPRPVRAGRGGRAAPRTGSRPRLRPSGRGC